MLRQTLRPSLRFAVLLSFAHLLLAAVIFETALPLPARLALSLAVMASLAYYLARDVFALLPESWKTVVYDRDGMTVITRNGAEFSGPIAGDSLVTPYCVVLRIRREGGRMAAAHVIFPDALAGDAFRELCVFLRFA